MRRLSLEVLIDAGYDVRAVKDGASGYEELLVNGYDLVITDNKMPKMTGVEMIEKVRSAGIRTPIIMATGILPTTIFAHYPRLKPDGMLQRPFSNEDFLKTVRRVLGPSED